MDLTQWKVVPVEATPDLLMSMAVPLDHALGLPGYYDGELFGKKLSPVPHDELLRQALSQCKQLHEEIVGTGFYKAAPTEGAPVLIDAEELAALRRDAARYRWLRDTPWMHSEYDDIRLAVQYHRNAEWDERIDAAIAKERKS